MKRNTKKRSVKKSPQQQAQRSVKKSPQQQALDKAMGLLRAVNVAIKKAYAKKRKKKRSTS